MTEARNITRVQMDLNTTSKARLDRLKDTTEASSYAEVMKNALRLYEDVINESEKGNTLMIKDSTGLVYPYKIFV